MVSTSFCCNILEASRAHQMTEDANILINKHATFAKLNCPPQTKYDAKRPNINQ